MGYLISTHFIAVEPDVARLREGLPGGLDFRVYRHDDLPLFAVDAFDEGAGPVHPFCVHPSAAAVGTELGPEPEPLSRAYEEARLRLSANSVRKTFVVAAQLISRALDT